MVTFNRFDDDIDTKLAPWSPLTYIDGNVDTKPAPWSPLTYIDDNVGTKSTKRSHNSYFGGILIPNEKKL